MRRDWVAKKKKNRMDGRVWGEAKPPGKGRIIYLSCGIRLLRAVSFTVWHDSQRVNDLLFQRSLPPKKEGIVGWGTLLDAAGIDPEVAQTIQLCFVGAETLLVAFFPGDCDVDDVFDT